MCNFNRVIGPNAKLIKMLGFAKILLIVNLLSSILRVWIRPTDILFDLLCCLFLWLGNNTLYFMFTALYVIFSLINVVYLFINCAMIFQMMIQKTLGNTNITIPLCFSLYLLVFYTFAIIFIYPMYKEMKAQLIDLVTGSSYRPVSSERADVENANTNNNNTNDPTSTRFVPFRGRGVQVG